MDPLELLGGAGTGGVFAAVAYKMLAVFEQQMKRKNGGTYSDILQEITRGIEDLGTELKGIKTVLYEVKSKQDQRDAVERDRALRLGVG